MLYIKEESGLYFAFTLVLGWSCVFTGKDRNSSPITSMIQAKRNYEGLSIMYVKSGRKGKETSFLDYKLRNYLYYTPSRAHNIISVSDFYTARDRVIHQNSLYITIFFHNMEPSTPTTEVTWEQCLKPTQLRLEFKAQSIFSRAKALLVKTRLFSEPTVFRMSLVMEYYDRKIRAR